MGIFIVTFCIMVLAVSGMAIGVVFGRAPIAGSCGGLNAVNGSGECLACSRPCRTARRARNSMNARTGPIAEAEPPAGQATLHDLREQRTR